MLFFFHLLFLFVWLEHSACFSIIRWHKNSQHLLQALHNNAPSKIINKCMAFNFIVYRLYMEKILILNYYYYKN